MPEIFDQNSIAEEATGPINDQPHVAESEKPPKDFSTTDPMHHDPTNFRYLVHAMNPDAALGLSIQRGQMQHESGYQMDESHPPLTAPDKFGTRGYISSSVIDQDHLGTWGGSGFILGVEPDNILVTSPTDAGTIPAKELDYLQRNVDLLSFPELMSKTDSNHYNEVVVSGSGERPPVRITGVFIKYWFDGHEYVPVDKRTAWKVEAFASMHQVPVVEIRLPKTEDFPLRLQVDYDEFGNTRALKMGRDGKEFSVLFTQFQTSIDKENGVMHDFSNAFINANTANYRRMTTEERLQFLEELTRVSNLPDTSNEMRDLIKRAQEYLQSEEAIKRDYTDPIDLEAVEGGMMHKMIINEPPPGQFSGIINYIKATNVAPEDES